jgi:hypothetical protein
MEVFGLLPPGSRQPDFTRPPWLGRPRPVDALLELARHVPNAGALGGGAGAGPGRSIERLAALLEGARFFALRPGPLEETAALLRREVLGP